MGGGVEGIKIGDFAKYSFAYMQQQESENNAAADNVLTGSTTSSPTSLLAVVLSKLSCPMVGILLHQRLAPALKTALPLPHLPFRQLLLVG